MFGFICTLPVFAANGAKGDNSYKQDSKDAYGTQHKIDHDGPHAYVTEDDIKKE
jgi:hypothetical protein